MAADPTQPDLVGVLDGAEAVVLVAAGTDLAHELAEGVARGRDRIIGATHVVVTAAAAAGVPHVVVIGSAMVHGALPDNPVPLSDDAPLRAPRDSGAAVTLCEVEDIVDAARRIHRGTRFTVLRPAQLMGLGVDTVLTRHFEAPRLLHLKSGHPRWQFCHVTDLASAVTVVLATRSEGAFGVGCDGSLAQDEVELVSGMRRIDIADSVAHAAARRLHATGLVPGSESDLAFITHPWVVGCEGLRALGWRPAYDNEQCLRELVDETRGRYAVAARRLDRGPAIGAASAAIALMGTAAIMRRRRKGTRS